MLRIGIIGAGLVGQKRATHLRGSRLIAVADQQSDRAEALAKVHNAQVETPDTLLNRADIDALIISTSHDALSSYAVRALEAGKHVLVEKPAGRCLEDIVRIKEAAQAASKTVGVGFNHRFHPGFQRAKDLLNENALGPLLYIRARYGHGGRLGYEREWRADPQLSGGGELLDQGVHLIDLCRWLGGEFQFRWGKAKRFFWQMPVEDNAFVYLESPDGARSAWLHASWTEWKNLFDFEIFCRNGKIEVWGLGRSYGDEELRIYRMSPQMGPPAIEVESFSSEDASWQSEFDAFCHAIDGKPSGIATIEDAIRTMEIVRATYGN